MSFPVWVEIVCATCSRAQIGTFVYNGQIPVRKLKAEAKSQGWLFTNKEAYCCVECANVDEVI